MTALSNNFEGGTDGIALTTSPNNTGGASGTPFDLMFGTGMVFKASSAQQGTMGARVAGGAIGAGQWNLGSTNTKVPFKIFFKPEAIPTSGDCYLVRVHDGTTRIFGVRVQGTGQLRVVDFAGTFVKTFSTVLTAGTYYRLEGYVVAGSTTSNGVIKIGFYVGLSTTPVETIYSTTAGNVGTGNHATSVYLGKYDAAPEAYNFDGAFVDTSLSDLPGVGTLTPPTVSTPPSQNVAASAAVSVSVTASSSSGTIQSYAWSVIYSSTTSPTLTGASTNTVGFTATSDTTKGHLYQLQCVVTDSNGQTTTVQTEVRVPTPGDATVLPGSPTNVVGAWSNVGGAATLGDALGDLSPSTYTESTNLSGTVQSERYRVAPMTARSSLDIPVNLSLSTSGAATVGGRIYQGATLLEDIPVPDAVTTTQASHMLSAAPATVSAITDWCLIQFEVYATSP